MWNPFKVNNKNRRKRHPRRSGVSIIKFEYISHIVLVFPFLILRVDRATGLQPIVGGGLCIDSLAFVFLSFIAQL